jgi:hypothetical protein
MVLDGKLRTHCPTAIESHVHTEATEQTNTVFVPVEALNQAPPVIDVISSFHHSHCCAAGIRPQIGPVTSLARVITIANAGDSMRLLPGANDDFYPSVFAIATFFSLSLA